MAAAVLVGCLTIPRSVPAACRQAAQDWPKASVPVLAPLAGDTPPSPAASIAAYRLVDDWIRAWAVPGDDSATKFKAAQDKPLARAVAAAVTLRFAGDVVGRGIAVVDRRIGEPAGGASVIARATREAMREAERRLPVPNDAGREVALVRVAGELTISLELAGRFTPIEPATWEEAERTLAPGLDGIRISVIPDDAGEEQSPGDSATMFPEFMLGGGILPHRAIGICVSRLLGEGGAAAALDPPALLRERHHLRMERFRVTHLMQLKPGAEPEFLYRGSRLLGADTVLSVAELEAMQDSVAKWLIGELVRIKGVSVSPWMNVPKERADPESPSMEQQALAAIALHQTIDCRLPKSRDPGGSFYPVTVQLEYENEVETTVARLWSFIKGTPIESMVLDDRFGGLFLAALHYEFRELRERVESERTKQPLDAKSLQDRRARLDAIWARPAEMSRALKAASVFGLMNRSSESQTARLQADEARKQFLREPDPIALDVLPFVGWTELLAAEPDGEIFGAIRFRELRAQLWQNQLRAIAAGPDRLDMIGGLLLSTTGTERTAYPTWQAARPLAFVATMLRHPTLTDPGQRSQELIRLLGTLRSLRQLQVDDSNSWMYRDPAKAIGGIRSAVWDNRLSIDSATLTLMCLNETLLSLDALRRRPVTKDIEKVPLDPAQRDAVPR